MYRSLKCVTNLPPVQSLARPPTRTPTGLSDTPGRALTCCERAKSDSEFQVVVRLKQQERVFCICDSHAKFGHMPPTAMQKLETFLCSPMYSNIRGDSRRVCVFEGGKCRATIRDNFSAAVLFLHLEDIRQTKQLAEALDASEHLCGSL